MVDFMIGESQNAKPASAAVVVFPLVSARLPRSRMPVPAVTFDDDSALNDGKVAQKLAADDVLGLGRNPGRVQRSRHAKLDARRLALLQDQVGVDGVLPRLFGVGMLPRRKRRARLVPSRVVINPLQRDGFAIRSLVDTGISKEFDGLLRLDAERKSNGLLRLTRRIPSANMIKHILPKTGRKLRSIVETDQALAANLRASHQGKIVRRFAANRRTADRTGLYNRHCQSLQSVDRALASEPRAGLWYAMNYTRSACVCDYAPELSEVLA